MNRKVKLIAIGMVVIMLLALTSCSTEYKLLGKWNIQSIETGGMTMTIEDFKEFGISSGGYVKFRKSGKCDVDFLGEEYTGTWELDDKDVVSLKIGKNKLTATATLKDDVLTMTDSNGTTYTMKQ